jgi:hypothetical protein
MKKKPPKVQKLPIDPSRLRRLPAEGFSWIDRRFVRDGFIDNLPPETNLLYFFLVAVCDPRGLSFYADPTISKLIKLNAQDLTQARARLIEAQLILYQYPLYQVLPLPPKVQLPAAPPPPVTQRATNDEFSPIAKVFDAVLASAPPIQSENREES